VKFLLPMVLLAAGFRIVVYPRIVSVKFGFTLDLTGYEFPIGGTLGFVGAILLAEALGYLKVDGTHP
jgi:hypothetical protein